MVVLLDTTLVPPEDREEAFHAALNSASSPVGVSVSPHAQGIIRAWPLSPEINLIDLQIKAPHLSMTRTRRHLRQNDPDRLSVAASHGGVCATINHGLHVTDNQRLRLTDVTAPYRNAWRGSCRAVAVELGYTRLGLSVEDVRAAQPQIHLSPLHDMLHRHLISVADSADSLSPQTTLLVGSSTADLVRATFASVSRRDNDRRSALAETLAARIEDFVRRHLGEPDLTPAQIAEAHNISLRYLYVLLAQKGKTPADWIMTLRLEHARQELATGAGTVTGTANRWGFKDATHFSRRFKSAYGITPREWAYRHRTTVRGLSDVRG